MTVSGLLPNKSYVFAAGGYTQDGICVNGIGETSEEILTVLPLNIQLLYCYLAQTCYKLKHYQIAKDAAEAVCANFVEKNDVKSLYLDSKISPIYAFKLKHKYCKLVSFPLLK